MGTVGRDMVYTMMALFLIVFLTEVLDLDDTTLWWVNGILLATRIFDAFTDIIMGGIIDNTSTRWGAYKPWISVGAVATGVSAAICDGAARSSLACALRAAAGDTWPPTGAARNTPAP